MGTKFTRFDLTAKWMLNNWDSVRPTKVGPNFQRPKIKFGVVKIDLKSTNFGNLKDHSFRWWYLANFACELETP